MIGGEIDTYRRMRLMMYGGLLVFGGVTLALTGDRDPVVIMLLAVVGVATSLRRIPFSAEWQFVFDLVAALGIAWFGRPLIGFVISMVAMGMGALTGRRLAATSVGGWLGVFSVAIIAMAGLGFTPTGFGPGRTVPARIVTSAVAATVVLFGGLAARRLRDLIVEAERKNAALDRRLMNLIGSSAVPMALVDTEGQILRANPALSELLGFENAELVIAHDSDLTHPGDFAVRPGLVADADGTKTVEKRYIHRSGRHIFTEVTAIVDGPASNPNLWLLQIKDLSDIRKARAEAVVTRMELDTLFDRIPVALYRSLPSGEVIAGNPELATLLGYASMDDLIASVGAAKAGYLDPADRERWKQLMDSKGTVMGFEQKMIRADGTTMVISDSATAIRDVDGSVSFYEGVMVDVTARSAAEASGIRLDRVLSATSDLVAITDSRGNILYANAAFKDFGGFPIDPEGRNILDFIPRESQADLVDLVAKTAAEGGSSGEIDIVTGTGREAVLSMVIQRHDGDSDSSAYFSGVGRDVTAERAIARRLEALLKSKDEFIASVSHELRTPLTAAVGIALELRDRLQDLEEDERSELISIMAEQTQEVANLVEDLLVAARMETDSVTFLHERVDLRKAVESALATVSYDRDHAVEVEGDLIAIADSRRVRQILRNLLTNAARYGGSAVSVTIALEGTVAAVHVTDSGPGIDPADHGRIFDAYQSAHNPVSQPSSVGLGLTVSRWLARGMGGDLTYTFNGSSVFSLTLPPGSAE